jgi:transposase
VSVPAPLHGRGEGDDPAAPCGARDDGPSDPGRGASDSGGGILSARDRAWVRKDRRQRRRERRGQRDALIKKLKGDGHSIKAIASELGIDPHTVRRALGRALRPERKRRASKLDPFKPLVRKLVLTDELSCVRVLEEIRAVGYAGSDFPVKTYVRTFRPKRSRRPHLRFETAPGVQGQVDLSPYTVLLSCVPTPVVCFSLVLGYSRWHFIRFVLHADVHSVCHSHVLAFEDAGGVPHEILYDRMKQVVLESHKDGVVFHPLFERMAEHYGYRAVPLAPGYKEGKGKVENPFRYVEGNFLAGRTFHDLDDLNQQARRWLEQTARVRVHRTTHEQPVARLAQEQPALIPLPRTRFEAGVVVTRLVGDDFCVPLDTNRYSVVRTCREGGSDELKCHPHPGRAGCRRGPRTPPRLERRSARAERPELPAMTQRV